MRAVLSIEAIGDDLPGCHRAWVAEISIDLDTGRLERRFVRGMRDYRDANGTGSRGVIIYYWLREGLLYEVNSPKSWRRCDRYYCRAENGDVVRLSPTEAARWLNDE